MEIGVDFKLRDDIVSDNLIPVELLVEPYVGVVYEYQDMRIVESPDPNQPHILQFKYKIHDPKDHKVEDLEENERFKTVIGLILNHMILTVMEADIANATREDDINEPNTQ
jgi:hypothetical protein